jgi:hypothetical protein
MVIALSSGRYTNGTREHAATARQLAAVILIRKPYVRNRLYPRVAD